MSFLIGMVHFFFFFVNSEQILLDADQKSLVAQKSSEKFTIVEVKCFYDCRILHVSYTLINNNKKY